MTQAEILKKRDEYVNRESYVFPFSCRRCYLDGFNDSIQLMLEREKVLRDAIKDVMDGKYKYYNTYEGDVETPTYNEFFEKVLETVEEWK